MTLSATSARTRVLIPSAALGTLAALALTGCSSGSTSTAANPTSPATTTASAAATSAGSAAPTTSSAPATSSAPSSSSAGSRSSQAALATKLASGIHGVTSNHISGRIAGASAAASGTIAVDQKITNGVPTAQRLNETIAGRTVGLIRIGTKAWVKLPGAPKAKPWLTVSSTSKNATARAVAASLARTSSQTSLTEYLTFARATSNITNLGSHNVDGVSATQYKFDVVVSKLPANTSTSALKTLGVTTIPTQMWIDGHGRPVRVRETVKIHGVATTTTLDLTRYNQAVSISPPPSSQIGG